MCGIPPCRYINSNGLFELFRGYSETLNSLVYQAVDKSNTINRLQLVLLVIEGCCICALVVAYMAWLLKKVRLLENRAHTDGGQC